MPRGSAIWIARIPWVASFEAAEQGVRRWTSGSSSRRRQLFCVARSAVKPADVRVELRARYYPPAVDVGRAWSTSPTRWGWLRVLHSEGRYRARRSIAVIANPLHRRCIREEGGHRVDPASRPRKRDKVLTLLPCFHRIEIHSSIACFAHRGVGFAIAIETPLQQGRAKRQRIRLVVVAPAHVVRHSCA